MVQDKEILERSFERQVDTFFYPFGSVNFAVKQIVGKYYINAFATEDGEWPSNSLRLSIRRLEVRPQWGFQEFCTEVENKFAEIANQENF